MIAKMVKMWLVMWFIGMSVSFVVSHGQKLKHPNSEPVPQNSVITSSFSVQRFASLNLTSNIKRYIEHEQLRLKIMKNFSGYEDELPFVKQRISEFKTIHKGLIKNATNSKIPAGLKDNHPTTIHAAVRNFLAAWEDKLANKTVYGKRLQEFLENNETKPLPARRDLNLIGTAISIIQATYNLSTNDLRKGRVLGQKGEPLNNADCYDIGKTIFQVGLLDVAFGWLEASISGYDLDKLNVSKATFNVSDALASIARIAFKRNDKGRARKLFVKATELEPENLSLHKEFVKHRFGRDVEDLPELNIKDVEPWRKKFYAMCKNSTNATLVNKQRLLLPGLTCRLRASASVPYLVYKEEILSKSPYISVILDFIGNKTVEDLKNSTLHLLKDSVLPGFHPFDLWHFRAKYFKDDHNEAVGNLSLRVGEVTGLDVSQASETDFVGEPVHVIDFGVGGLLLPHEELQMRYTDQYNGRSRGKRFATLHVYLSDVAAGGATVFIEQNITVIPKQGSAVLWYNYKPSGEPEVRLLSATCPLAVGHNIVLEKGVWLPSDDVASFCGRSSKSTFLTSHRIHPTRGKRVHSSTS